MNFYAFNIGDYAGATRHLTWDEDMAYRRMLDAYYSREAPLPLDRRQIYRLVGASEERQREAVDAVLVEFFVEQEDGWHNNWADEEIGKAAEKSTVRAERKENERERQRRHRARRKELFELLRERGIVPKFDTPTAELEEIARHAPVTVTERDSVTGQNTPSPATRDVRRDTANVTRDKPTVTRDETRDRAPVTPDITAINPNPNPNNRIAEVVARDPDMQLEHRLRVAAGWQNELSPRLTVTGPIQALLDAGADLELDVLPVIKAIAPQAEGRSWNYFVKAIARARDQRIEAATVISMPTPSSRKPANGSYQRKPTRAEAFAAIDRRIEQLAEAERREAAGGSPRPLEPDEGEA